jgi:hypothetical protein
VRNALILPKAQDIKCQKIAKSAKFKKSEAFPFKKALFSKLTPSI